MRTEIYESLFSDFHYENKFVSNISLKKKTFSQLKELRKIKNDFSADDPNELWLIENYSFLAEAIFNINFLKLKISESVFSLIERLINQEKFSGSNGEIRSFLEELSKKIQLSEKEIWSIPPQFYIILVNEIYTFARSNKEKISKYFCLLHEFRKINFESIMKPFSPVEQCFQFDAAGLYSSMTRKTQEMYRHWLFKEAKAKKIEVENLAKEKLELSRETKRHIGHFLKKPKKSRIYVPLCYLLFLILWLSFLVKSQNVVLSLLFIFPLCSFCQKALDFFSSLVFKSEALPQMRVERVDRENKTSVVITSLVCNEKDVDSLCEKIFEYGINNAEKEDELYFGLLLDFPECDKKILKSDASIADYVKLKIEAMNEKFEKFFAVIRGRSYISSEGKFAGFERKRGAIQELVSFLNGTAVLSAPYQFGVLNKTVESKYLITLDQDTHLSIGQAKRLIGTISHPLISPVLNEKKGRCVVSSGHAIIQPKISSSLLNPVQTPFGKIVSNGGGDMPYATASFDRMQDFYGEGNFCGKGILDVACFDAVMKDVIPNESILSHDMPEGALLRCALSGDETFHDSEPQSVESYYKRLHRWIRGDTQNIILLSYLSGFRKRMYFENLVSFLIPAAEFFLLVISSHLGKSCGLAVALFIVFFHSFNLLVGVLRSLFGGSVQHVFRRFSTKIRNVFLNELYRTLLQISSIAFEAYYFLDAIFRSLYRMTVSRKKLLQWQVYSPVTGKNPLLFFLPSTVLGAVSLFFCTNVLSLVIFLLWVAFPLFCYYLSRKYPEKQTWSPSEMNTFYEMAKNEFRFFQENVNERTKDLPPDNIQLDPIEKIAMRTSPTNIGLYLASLLAARDLNFINSQKLYESLSRAVCTLQKLEHFHGHLYNWYDLENLSVIGDHFVSTVDSGNYFASLVCVYQGLQEYVKEESRLSSIRKFLLNEIVNADFSTLFDYERGLFSVGIDTENGIKVGHYDFYMSEARITSFLAIALGQIPFHHWKRLNRPILSFNGRAGVASWSGTAFEFFMAPLFLPVIENSQEDESLDFAHYCQEKYSANDLEKRGVFGISESGYSQLDAHDNYQYHAFGVPYLSIQDKVYEQKVISPYSSFLMLERGHRSVLKNLKRLEKIGMCSSFGFYEACEFHSHFYNDFKIIRSYMAHHKGMSILSLTNVLKGNLFVKRFISFENFSAKKELLAERFPIEGKVYKKKRELIQKEKEPAFSPLKPTILSSSGEEGFLLTDGTTTLVLLSDGRLQVINNIGHWFDKNSFSLTVFLGNTKIDLLDAKSYPTKKILYHQESVEIQCSFEKTLISFVMRILPEKKSVHFEMEVNGFRGTVSLEVSFLPILQNMKEYHSHPAFHRLSVELFAENDNIFIRKRGVEHHKILSVWSDQKMQIKLDQETFYLKRDPIPLFYRNLSFMQEFNSNGRAKSSFVLSAFEETKEDLLPFSRQDLKITKNQNQKMHAVCQYTDASLILERKMLSCFYGANRFIQTEKLEEIKKTFLWKHGISGDFPLFVFHLQGECENDLSNLEEFLKVGKKFHLAHLHIDFVVLRNEKNHYLDPIDDKLTVLLSKLRLQFLVGRHPGIHLVKVNEERELDIFCKLSKLWLPIQNDIRNQILEWDDFKVHSLRNSNGNSDSETIGKMTSKKFYLNRTEFDPPVPFSHVISNRIVGFVCNQNSLGYTWFYNSALFRISKWNNFGESEKEEKIYLERNGKILDLLQKAEQIQYQEHFVFYRGKIDGFSFTVAASVLEKICGKYVYVELDEALAKDSKIIYSFIPQMGREEDYNFQFENSGNFVLFSPVLEGDPPFRGYFSCGHSKIETLKNNEKILFVTQANLENSFYLGAYRSEKQLAFIRSITQNDLPEDLISQEMGFCKDVMPKDFISELDFWVFYQAVHARFFGRTGLYQSGGAYGFRDQLQDSLIFLDHNSNITKMQILRAASHQFEDGTVLHWWHPKPGGNGFHAGIRSRCSDDYLWLLYVTSEYINATGDLEILKMKAPFLKSFDLNEKENEKYVSTEFARTGTILEHLEKCVDQFFSRKLGENLLPDIGCGDWNDGMNQICGESVWLGFFSSICLNRTKSFFSKSLQEKIDNLLFKMNQGLKNSFNGAWFPRVYADHGKVYGSDISLESECSIDLITQAFAAFYEIEFRGTEFSLGKDKIIFSLESSFEILTNFKNRTVALFTKPFVKTHPSPGYIQRYCAGFRENGGQYTHAAVWFALALIKFGKIIGDQSLIEKGKRISDLLDPSKNLEYSFFKKYQREPYVLCGDVYTAKGLKGHGGWSWYTGAASWYHKLLKEIQNLEK